MSYKFEKIQITPINPQGDLIAFGSLIFSGLFLGSIALHTKPDGHLNLSFPSKKVGEKNIHSFYCVDEELKNELTKAFESKAKEIKLLSYGE